VREALTSKGGLPVENLDSVPVLGNSASPDTDSSFSAKPLNPYYVTGFADGESSFIVIIRKEPRLKTG